MAGACVTGYRIIALAICLIAPATNVSKAQNVEKKTIAINNSQGDSTRINRKAAEVIERYHRKGYISASLDSITADSVTSTLYFYEGQQYTWSTIRFDSVLFLYPSLLRKLQTNYRGKVSPGNVKKGPELILGYLAENGYPYTRTGLVEIEIQEGRVAGKLTIERGKLVKFDTVITRGTVRIKPWFMPLYLGIERDEPFDEQLIRSIPQKTARLPYLRTASPHALEFYENTADVYLYLDREKANRFNGLIGLGRNSQTNKTELTVELDLILQNSLAAGEQIELLWRKPGPASQKLHTGMVYPFLFRSPVGASIHFRLYQQDSSYMSLTLPFELRFMMPGGNFIGLHYQWDRSIVQKADAIDPANAADTNSLIDFVRNLAGAGFFLSNTDRYLNPTHGTKAQMNFSGGYRTILKNPEAPPAIYDSIALKSSTLLMSGEITRYWMLIDHFVFSAGASAAYILASSVFANEMYRIGGLYTLRGFDEDFYRTRGYGIAKAELNYLIGGLSSLFVFYDQGILIVQGSCNQAIRPYGFGAGINLEVRSGVFSLLYALGKRPDEPISLREARIHFGITARF